MVRGAGLEPAQYCYRQDLNLVRLPISPPARVPSQWLNRSTFYFNHGSGHFPIEVPIYMRRMGLLAVALRQGFGGALHLEPSSVHGRQRKQCKRSGHN